MFRPAPTNIAAMTGNVNYDAAAVAYFAAVVTAGGTLSTSDKTIYNTLFAGLRTDGLLSVLDRLSVAAPTATPTLVDLVSLTTQTAVSSPTFTASAGYAGNGSTSYINTGFNPGDGGGPYNFVQNSAMFGCYVRTSRTSGSNTIQIGNSAATNTSQISTWYGDNNTYLDVNDNAAVSNTMSHAANAQGMYVGVRTAAGAVALYRNGASLGTGTLASQGIANHAFFVCGCNNGSDALTGGTSEQIAAWYGGAQMNATQVSNFTTRVNNFLTSYGTNVF